ncbi:hypothetical protein SLS62_001891 [Diatrype stigma]|uniref:Zn(2)-C6 fungal-type domain-containing protein n=1 Tax=Diatrype stigma TaxID=117547 RepID=A0AAN9UUT9_9PEZI
MRANEIPPFGFTPESDTTSAASPGRSPSHRVFQAHPIGYPDANPAVHPPDRPWMHDNSNRGRTHAPRACEKCRLSKRKCDKKLPHCDRLNARCHYLPDPASANATANGAPIVVYQAASLSDDLMLRHVDPLAGITASQILSLIPPSQAAAPPAAGPPEPNWRPSVGEFFTFVHPWFAVVHPILFERQIGDLLFPSSRSSSSAHEPSPPVTAQKPSPVSNSHDHPMSIKNAVSGYHQRTGSMATAATAATASTSTSTSSPPPQSPGEHHRKQLALLVVVMHLITQLRCTEAGCRPMFGPAYRTVKRLLALMLMGYTEGSQQQRPTIELVQCGAIMALYEYGHGDAATAYRTLGETVAAASILGVRPGLVDPGAEKSVPGLDLAALPAAEKEQRGGLWWGLFILDQFIHKDDGTHHLPFLLETPSESALLPETPPAPLTFGSPIFGGGGYFNNENKVEAQSMRIPTSVVVGTARLGPFQLSAKIASLLHRALRIDKERDPRPVKMPRTATFADLDDEVRRTSHTLLEQTIQWETMLDCFAMLVSALFTLYLPYLAIIENTAPAAIAADNELATALAALQFACKLSTDVSCRINRTIDATPAPPPLYHHYQPPPNQPHYYHNNNNHHHHHHQHTRSGSTSTSNSSLAILAAPAGATCYAVIVAFAGFQRIFPAERERCREAIAEKFESLRLFSLRWGIAEAMIRQLEEHRGIHRSDYLLRRHGGGGADDDEEYVEEEDEDVGVGDGERGEGGEGGGEIERDQVMTTTSSSSLAPTETSIGIGVDRMILT